MCPPLGLSSKNFEVQEQVPQSSSRPSAKLYTRVNYPNEVLGHGVFIVLPKPVAKRLLGHGLHGSEPNFSSHLSVTMLLNSLGHIDSPVSNGVRNSLERLKGTTIPKKQGSSERFPWRGQSKFWWFEGITKISSLCQADENSALLSGCKPRSLSQR